MTTFEWMYSVILSSVLYEWHAAHSVIMYMEQTAVVCDEYVSLCSIMCFLLKSYPHVSPIVCCQPTASCSMRVFLWVGQQQNRMMRKDRFINSVLADMNEYLNCNSRSLCNSQWFAAYHEICSRLHRRNCASKWLYKCTYVLSRPGIWYGFICTPVLVKSVAVIAPSAKHQEITEQDHSVNIMHFIPQSAQVVMCVQANSCSVYNT